MPNTLIFGATSAIASEVAELWAARGERLYLVGRNAQKLARVAERCSATQVTTRVADLAQLHENGALVRQIAAELGSIDTVLIAHGELGDQLASEQSFERAEEILRVNLSSAVSLLIPLAQQLEAQGRGRLAVITSVAGDRGRPRNYTYAAAKAGLGTYLQGLRTRLRPRGVSVTTLKLGLVDTPMTAHRPKHWLFTDTKHLAPRIVQAIDAATGEVYLPRVWRWIMPLVATTPEWLVQRISWLSGR